MSAGELSSHSQQNHNQQLQCYVYQRYLQDVSNLRESKEFACNQYLDGQVYSLLFSNQLILYFIFKGQVVSINMPHIIEVKTARNVFVFEAQQAVLGITGHLVIAFGLTNFTLIHVDEQYRGSQGQTEGYQILWTKDYTHLQVTNHKECLSVVKLAEVLVTNVPRTNFPQQEFSFMLGAASQQKVVQLKVTLRNDPQASSSGLYSVMTSHEENLFYEEQKSITSRFSSFISAKLGYRDQDLAEATGHVKDLHVIENFVLIITNKDIIIVRRSDNVKLYETEYLEGLKQWSQRKDQYDNMHLMRELLQFKILTTSSIHMRSTNQICLNLIILKTQLVSSHQSYETVKQTHILHHPKIFNISKDLNEIEERQDVTGSQNIYFYDLNRYGASEISRSFAFNFEVFTPTGEDVTTLLFLEYAEDGKTLAIEHSLSNNLENLKQLKNLRLNGYNAFTYLDEVNSLQVVNVTLISQNDIDFYEFYPQTQQFSLIQPSSISEKVVIQNLPAASQVPRQAPQRQAEIHIVHRDQLRQYIYTFLDKIANYKYAVLSKAGGQGALDAARQQAQNEIIQSLQASFSQVQKADYIAEIKQILYESIDFQINDSHFSNVNGRGNEINLVFNDDGLVQNSLDNKAKKMEVIEDFIRQLIQVSGQALPNLDDIFTLINELQFKLFMAQAVKNLQEQMKVDFLTQMNGEQRILKHTEYPLQMRLLAKVISLSAERLGFTKVQLQQLGVTPANIIYAMISKIDVLFQTLIDLSLQDNIGFHLELNQGEDLFIALHSICKIFNQVLEAVISNSDFQLQGIFLADQDVLNGIFKLCERLTKGVNEHQTSYMANDLYHLCDQFMIITRAYEATGSGDQINLWKINLVIFIENSMGKERALQFAERYQARDLLCRLVLELGEGYYHVLYNCIKNWSPDFLLQSMEIIYKLERMTAQKSREPLQKESYRGFKMFEIYEGLYIQQLAEFLSRKNKKLHCLLNLRHQNAQAAHALLKEQVVPSIKDVEAMKVFTSLGIANLEKGIEGLSRQQIQQEEAFFEQRLNVATVQSKIAPEEEKLVAIDRPFLEKAFEMFNQQDPKDSCRQLLKIINSDAVDIRALPSLKEYAWGRVLRHDEESVRRLQLKLPMNSSDLHTHTEDEIRRTIQGTLVFFLAAQFNGQQASLDEGTQSHLLTQFQDLQRGLNAIFSHLRSRDNANLFAHQRLPQQQQPSLFIQT